MVSTDLDERIVALEIRISFLDKTIEDLSSVIATQQGSIEQLVKKLELLVEQMNNGVVEKGDEIPPPHY